MKKPFTSVHWRSKLPMMNTRWRAAGVAFLLNLSFISTSQAQDKIWDKTFGGVKTGVNADNEACGMYKGTSGLATILKTPDGGYLLAGTSDSEQGNDKSQKHYGALEYDCYFEDDIPIVDYWLVKIDASGNKQWDKILGGSDHDRLVKMVATLDGGYLLAGNSRSDKSHDKSEAAITPYDYWLVKIDATGNKIWDKTLGNIGFGLATLTATPDGGYLLGDANFKALKINENGQKIWQKEYSSSALLSTVIPTPGGGYLLGGYRNDENSPSGSSPGREYSNYFVIQVDAQGNKQWEKIYGGNKGDELTSIVTTPDGGFLLGGNSTSEASGDKTEPNWGKPATAAGFYPSDYWIVKIDNKGNKIWDKRFGGTGNDELITLEVTPENNYILVGNSNSSQNGNKSEINQGTDYWLVKVDANGNKIWDKTYAGTGYDQLRAVYVNTDGTLVIGGTSRSGKGADKSQDIKGEADFWIIKVQDKTVPEATAWNMRYGGSGNEGFTTVIKTQDGGYLSGGHSLSGVGGDKNQASRGKNDYWIVKSDVTGKKLWDKRFGGSGEDYLNSVIQTQDGGYLLGGSSLSPISDDKTESSRGDRDYWVVKISSTGKKEWDKRFGGSGYDELKKVLQLPSGEYILAGTSNSPAGGDKSQGSQGGQDYWIVKINSSGKKIWDKRYGGSQNDALEGLALSLDKGLLLGGTSLSGISGDKTQASRGGSDYWLVRVDATGKKVWDKRFGGSGEDNLTALGSTNTATGNFFIAGYSTSGKNGDKTQTSQGGQDYWMLKINGNGAKFWDQRFGGSGSDVLRSIILTQDGGYLLGGSSASPVSGNKTQASQGASDYWIVKTDANGRQKWDKRYGGNSTEELRSVLQTNDGGYLLGGRSDSGVSGDKTQPSQGRTDYWLVKVAPVANSSVAARTASPIEETTATRELTPLTAYPNPFNEKVTVSFTVPQTQPATLKVLDNQGREIKTLFQAEAQANQTYQVEWQANQQEAGMYLLQLQTPTGQNTRKVLLNK